MLLEDGSVDVIAEALTYSAHLAFESASKTDLEALREARIQLFHANSLKNTLKRVLSGQ